MATVPQKVSGVTRDSGIVNCELNIAHALRDSPLVRLLAKALKDSGCSLIPARHLVCENCSPQVEGTVLQL